MPDPTEPGPAGARDPRWRDAWLGPDPRWVRLRRPWRLRGVRALIRRDVPGGYEVEIRDEHGLPTHLVVPARSVELLGPED